MYEQFLLNLQVRFAVGYENLGDGYFGIRTVYNFRDSLSTHMQETGENLLDKAFEQVTDEQLRAFAIATDKQRMDSTQIASDIRKYSRLQLVVEVLQRVERMLTPDDKIRHEELLAPYCKGKSSHYIYRLQSNEYESNLAAIGPVMYELVNALSTDYGDEPTYEMLVRVFGEHFILEDEAVELLPAEKVAATSLQSPDDPEATFRRKNGVSYQGYVANITETCNPDNDFQLITKSQTESNVTDDAAMMVEALPELAERTDIDTLCTDGGYNSPNADPVLDEYGVDHIQTAIRGGKPDPNQVSVADFTFAFNSEHELIQATCPQGQTFPIELGRTEDRFIGRPDSDICKACLFFSRCPVRPKQQNCAPALYLNQRQILIADKRQKLDALPPHLRNLRPVVESTVRSIKHPFRQGKILLRGKFRIASSIIASAFMVNARRIHRAAQSNPTTAASAQIMTLSNSLFGTFSSFFALPLTSFPYLVPHLCHFSCEHHLSLPTTSTTTRPDQASSSFSY
ncbi:MAG: hypothetical protein AAF702_50930 [Chloroflexota bacterium]